MWMLDVGDLPPKCCPHVEMLMSEIGPKCCAHGARLGPGGDKQVVGRGGRAAPKTFFLDVTSPEVGMPEKEAGSSRKFEKSGWDPI